MDMWSERNKPENKGAPKTAANKTLAKGLPQTPLVVKSKDRITVTDEALATIIGLAAHEVPGVVGMAPATIREGLKRILGVRQADEGVVIGRFEEAAEANVKTADPNAADLYKVDLHVVVAYGVNIPVVAESVRERVQYAAEAYAGVAVPQVVVHVAGVSRG